MDKIIVLDGGKVVGQGKHEQLIINCEIYRQMLEKEKKLSATLKNLLCWSPFAAKATACVHLVKRRSIRK